MHNHLSESDTNKKKSILYRDKYLKYDFKVISDKLEFIICGEVV